MTRAFAFASVLFLGSIAQAQSSGLGSCVGMLRGTIGLSVPIDGKLVSVSPNAIDTVFGAAECQCGNDAPSPSDIHAEIKLTTALPAGTAGTVEVWVGAGCDNYTTRALANAMTCEKVATLDVSEFSTAASNQGLIEIPVPAKALYSPVRHMCGEEDLATNSVYVLLFTNPLMPYASCALNLTEENAQPAPGMDLTATVDLQGMVTVKWVEPPAGANSPSGYQVLCTPPGKLAQPSQFSACDNGQLHRRALPIGDPGTTTAGGDLIACSGKLDATASSTTFGPITQPTRIRLAALTFRGNGALSPEIDVVPLSPEEQLASRHGCSLGGAGATPPWAVLALLVALALRRRRAAPDRR
jgi:MYXO-CTERM domain-containing protein